MLESLSGVYLEYAKKNRLESPKKGFNLLFEKWLNLDPLEIKPLHKDFLDNVRHLVTELVSVLERLDKNAPDVCRDYTGKAFDIMFAPKPDKPNTDVDRYLAIAEYESVPLFSFASLDDLRRIRDELLKRTPKRFMLPKQLEMIGFMENMISEKRDVK